MDYFHVNANYIFWKTNHVIVPFEQYTVINRTASSVTFTDISLLNIQLTCNIRTFGQIDQNVYGIRVISGRKCFTFFLFQTLSLLLNYNFNVCCLLVFMKCRNCQLCEFWTFFFSMSLELHLQYTCTKNLKSNTSFIFFLKAKYLSVFWKIILTLDTPKKC